MKPVARNLVLISASAIAVQACSPVPRHTLTTEEKVADLYWVYSQFGENYAPLELKQKLYSFDYETLKKSTLAASEKTASNEEFYNLLFGFVATFRDAHTSGSLNTSALPGRVQTAYLGFSGKRKGNGLVVTELLPTIVAADSNYPIKAGDVITALDGVPLTDVVRTEMVKLRNLGNDESNLTYHMNRVFNRTSISGGMPASTDAKITYVRGGKTLDVTLPWVTKDLVTFSQEQAAAKKKASEGKNADKEETQGSAVVPEESVFDLATRMLSGGKGVDQLVRDFQKTVRSSPGFRYMDTFFFQDTMPTWSSEMVEAALRKASGQPQAPLAAADDPESLANQRQVPKNVFFLQEAKAYPTYISLEKQMDAQGKPTGKSKMVAYMYLNTFSPSGGEEAAVKEVAATLKTLQSNGVKDLVIDLINNGGGSLNFGMKLAQLLSPEKVVMPDMEFRLSDNWLDQFDKDSREAASDSEKEIARRVLVALQADRDSGKRLSRRFNGETLVPFSLQKNTDLGSKLNIVLMTNEMCASMCDIFTGIMKDNGLATVVGAKTMGAGGNVVDHYESPNAHFVVRQTESLMVRSTGAYVENAGIDPDVAMAVNESVTEKYEPVRKKALEVLFSKE